MIKSGMNGPGSGISLPNSLIGGEETAYISRAKVLKMVEIQPESVAIDAEAGEMAPAGAHSFHIHFWVVADPVLHGAPRPFTRPLPGSTYPLIPSLR